MTNEISQRTDITNLKPIGCNANTGMAIYQSFQARSGFNYQVGVRDTHGLLIIEGVAEGTACTFLCGIQVRDKETGKEICSIPAERNTRYSRQLVMEMVHQHLCNAIEESALKEGKAADRVDVEKQVAEMLDDCYFTESRKAALSWAERVGIIH